MNTIWQTWRYRTHFCVLSVQNDKLDMRLYERKQNRISLLDSESLGMGKEELDVIKQLNSLNEKYQLFTIQTEFILPIDKVRRTFVKLPENFEGEPDEWLYRKVLTLLPPGMQEKDIVWGYRLYENSKLSDTALITMTHTNLIQKWQVIFNTANLRLKQITGDCLSCVDTLNTVQPDFFEGNSGLLVFVQNNLVSLFFENADLSDYSETRLESFDLQSCTAKITEIVDSHSLDKICLTDWHNDLSSKAINEIRQELKAQVPGLDCSVLPDAVSLGCVIGDQSSMFETIDLRTEDIRFEFEEAEEKQKMQMIGAGVLATLFLLFILIFSFRLVVLSEYDNWQAQVTQMESRITQIEALKQKQKTLIQELNSRKLMLGRRSQVARDLFEIARNTPEDVWLRDMYFGRFADDFSGKEGKSAGIDNIYIRGLSLREGDIGSFLRNLEQAKHFRNSTLQFIRNIPAEQVYKKTKLRKIPLSEFEIEIAQ